MNAIKLMTSMQQKRQVLKLIYTQKLNKVRIISSMSKKENKKVMEVNSPKCYNIKLMLIRAFLRP